MRFSTSVVLLLCIGNACHDAASQETSKEFGRFHGEWRITGGSRNGMAPTEEEKKSITVTFRGNKMIMRNGEGEEMTSEMTIDATKSPAWLSFVTQDEFEEKADGIYKFEGDTLTICINRPNRRPTKFAAPDKSDKLMILQRKAK